MPSLFDPFKLRDISLRNRVGVSPMCQYSSKDGEANDWHLVHLGSFATGGAALIIAEATAVDARGRITPGDAGIWADKHIEPLARIVRFLKLHGAVAGIQLAHAGRKASAARPWEGGHHLSPAQGGWDIIAPSALAFGDGLDRVPTEMTAADMASVRQAFVDAAKRSLLSGYEWLELHAAHGYLLHSFHSPLSNWRTDQYGNSFENRIRFTLEVVRAVRAVWPERLPLTVRISATDWTERGWTIEDSVALAKKLKEEGVDLIDCSSGGIAPGIKIQTGPGYQVPFAEKVRREASIATAAVGMITEPKQADAIIGEGKADIVLLAREFLRDPHWTARAAKELGVNAQLMPIQYGRA